MQDGLTTSTVPWVSESYKLPFIFIMTSRLCEHNHWKFNFQEYCSPRRQASAKQCTAIRIMSWTQFPSTYAAKPSSQPHGSMHWRHTSALHCPFTIYRQANWCSSRSNSFWTLESLEFARKFQLVRWWCCRAAAWPCASPTISSGRFSCKSYLRCSPIWRYATRVKSFDWWKFNGRCSRRTKRSDILSLTRGSLKTTGQWSSTMIYDARTFEVSRLRTTISPTSRTSHESPCSASVASWWTRRTRICRETSANIDECSALYKFSNSSCSRLCHWFSMESSLKFFNSSRHNRMLILFVLIHAFIIGCVFGKILIL